MRKSGIGFPESPLKNLHLMRKKCVSGKNSYPTPAEAEDALVALHARIAYPPNKGPISIYQCSDCGEYHFTSEGEMNARLARLMADGSIRRMREANRWKDKLRKR